MGILNNLITGKDNETQDIARVVMLINAVLLVPVLCAGIFFYVYGYVTGKPFDIQTLFTAVLTYEGGVGALLTSGATAILLKRKTEPDGTSEDVVSVKHD